MNYYQKQFFIPQVDKQDNIIGKVERWEAHKKGILHRGFTAVLVYKDKLVVQHRHHPVFDGFFDVSFSSHQIYLKDGSLQFPTSVITEAFKREWQIKDGVKIEPREIGVFYYKKRDPNSMYSEHEINHVFTVEIEKFPLFNPLFAYGASLIDKRIAKDKKFPLFKAYAPWVEPILNRL